MAARLMVRSDDLLHWVKCRQYKAGRLRLFRLLVRVCRPLCDRVSLLDHVR